jgi:hypothetical protein
MYTVISSFLEVVQTRYAWGWLDRAETCWVIKYLTDIIPELIHATNILCVLGYSVIQHYVSVIHLINNRMQKNEFTDILRHNAHSSGNTQNFRNVWVHPTALVLFPLQMSDGRRVSIVDGNEVECPSLASPSCQVKLKSINRFKSH